MLMQKRLKTIAVTIGLLILASLIPALAKGSRSSGGSHYSSGGGHHSSGASHYSSTGSHHSSGGSHYSSYSTGSSRRSSHSLSNSHNSNYFSGVKRDSHGRIARSSSARQEFMTQTGYSHGRPGYVVDHVIPLKRGGCDCPANMQWQTKADAKA